MSWWQVLIWIVVGVLAFDCLLIGLLYASNRPMRRCPQMVQPDSKGAGQSSRPSLWTVERGGG
jgi:hypothetical protein